MKKIFFLLLLPFFSLGQKQAIDFNYSWADTATIRNNIANIKQEMQATFYADSIPLKEWFIDTKDTIENSMAIMSSNDSLFRSIIIKYPWTKDFPVSDYRVLSIYNPANYSKKLYTYNELVQANKSSTQYAIEKIFCILQAKDEKGNWKDVNLTQNDINKIGIWKMFIRAHEVINIIVKPPSADMGTELRFKLLVNSPPDYPQEQYIYSNIFKGTTKK